MAFVLQHAFEEIEDPRIVLDGQDHPGEVWPRTRLIGVAARVGSALPRDRAGVKRDLDGEHGSPVGT